MEVCLIYHNFFLHLTTSVILFTVINSFFFLIIISFFQLKCQDMKIRHILGFCLCEFLGHMGKEHSRNIECPHEDTNKGLLWIAIKELNWTIGHQWIVMAKKRDKFASESQFLSRSLSDEKVLNMWGMG